MTKVLDIVVRTGLWMGINIRLIRYRYATPISSLQYLYPHNQQDTQFLSGVRMASFICMGVLTEETGPQ